MIFISLGKFRKKPTKEMTDEVTKMTMDMAEKEGINILSSIGLLADMIQWHNGSD